MDRRRWDTGGTSSTKPRVGPDPSMIRRWTPGVNRLTPRGVKAGSGPGRGYGISDWSRRDGAVVQNVEPGPNPSATARRGYPRGDRLSSFDVAKAPEPLEDDLLIDPIHRAGAH